MVRTTWKSKRIIIICISMIIFYLCVRLRSQSVSTIAVLQNVPPKDVWEFVADFSNMKILNPTIVDFNILSESGNYDHWKYQVEYTELLSHWPYLENKAIGNFGIRPEDNDYVIDSIHNTCFLGGWFCLKSISEFRFSSATGTGTRCVEKIAFECPAIFSSFCLREAKFQRTAIMDNLRQQFSV